MSQQQPDTLFRKKLQGYQKSLSDDAWTKIEMNLAEKNKMPVLKIAASLSVIILATYLFWLASSPEIRQSRNNIRQGQRNKTVSGNEVTGVENLSLIKKDDEIKSLVDRKKKSNLNTIQSEITTPNKRIAIESTIHNDQPVPVASVIDQSPIESPIMKYDTADEVSGADSRNINASYASNAVADEPIEDHVTLIYTVEEVREKYLTKNKTEEATLPLEKTSTFKKLLNKVYDLKNNQDAFGELRQKKDEILALNFKKRTEN